MIILKILLISMSWAQNAAPVLTLEKYLDQVQRGNPQARSLVAAAEAAEVKVRQAELGTVPEFFAEYNAFDDKTPPIFPFSPKRKNGNSWKVGVGQETSIGLGAKLYFEDTNTTLHGINPQFLPTPSYNQGRAVLELRQALIRNGFGELTRATRDAQKASAQADLENIKFNLKKVLLEAENAYWSLVTYNQVVELQEENVSRAQKLSGWMSQQGKKRLVDDVDALQAKTAYDMRQMELATSRSEREAVIRTFNTLRGLETSSPEKLQGLPQLSPGDQKLLSAKVKREDFSAAKNSTVASEMQAKIGYSSLRPQVDLVGSVASNGLDQRFSGMYSDVKDLQYPSWSVGVQIKFPLNIFLVRQLRAATKKDVLAAQEASANVDLQLQQAWNDLVQKQKEYFDIFQRSQNIEESYGTIVQKERMRLQNGRSSTFNLINLEQTRVTAQIQRTKSQLLLLQIQNILKTFEVTP